MVAFWMTFAVTITMVPCVVLAALTGFKSGQPWHDMDGNVR